MQLLSLCFYHVLCVQYLHGWELAALLSPPSQDRDSRLPPATCAHRDNHWFPFQLAFCLEGRRKWISRDLWSKETKQPECPAAPYRHLPLWKEDDKEELFTSVKS